jgi:hypothetical protein
MKRITVLIGLLFLMGGIAYGGQPAPRGAEGSQIRQGGGDESAPRSGPRFGPPPEAFKACEGKTEGSMAQFIGPDGETVTGACRTADGRLVLRPDRPRGNSRDGRRDPPPEAYKACEGKSPGSSAQFINPRGETVKGTCEEEDGKLVLRPDALKGDRQGQAYDKPGKGRVVK